MADPLTRDDVVKVATLARLKLSESEIERFTSQLGQVLEYIDVLNEIDTDNVEPMAHAAELRNVFRDDNPRQSLPREKALANAPQTDGRFFQVPRILDGS